MKNSIKKSMINNTTKLHINLILIFISIFIIISCKNNHKENNHLVFRYNERANVSSLDPAFAKAQNNIWVCNQLIVLG